MVFVNDAWNNTGDIVVYSNYHKYWMDKVEMFALGKAI